VLAEASSVLWTPACKGFAEVLQPKYYKGNRIGRGYPLTLPVSSSLRRVIDGERIRMVRILRPTDQSLDTLDAATLREFVDFVRFRRPSASRHLSCHPPQADMYLSGAQPPAAVSTDGLPASTRRVQTVDPSVAPHIPMYEFNELCWGQRPVAQKTRPEWSGAHCPAWPAALAVDGHLVVTNPLVGGHDRTRA